MSLTEAQIPTRNHPDLAKMPSTHFKAFGTVVFRGEIVSVDYVAEDSPLLHPHELVIRYGDRLVVSTALSPKPETAMPHDGPQSDILPPETAAIYGFLGREAAIGSFEF